MLHKWVPLEARRATRFDKGFSARTVRVPRGRCGGDGVRPCLLPLPLEQSIGSRGRSITQARGRSRSWSWRSACERCKGPVLDSRSSASIGRGCATCDAGSLGCHHRCCCAVRPAPACAPQRLRLRDRSAGAARCPIGSHQAPRPPAGRIDRPRGGDRRYCERDVPVHGIRVRLGILHYLCNIPSLTPRFRQA